MIIKKVYLAGPVTGLTFGAASRGWRQYVAHELDRKYHCGIRIHCYNPMRECLHLDGDLPIHAHEYPSHPLTSEAGIIARDRHDVKTSDLVFFNLLGATGKSLGSTGELGWADAWGKPIVLAMEKGRDANVHDHVFWRRLPGFHCDTLDLAIECARSVLLPYPEYES